VNLCSHHEPSHDGTVYRCDRDATEPGGVCEVHARVVVNEPPFQPAPFLPAVCTEPDE
jgi:hypothetical protein